MHINFKKLGAWLQGELKGAKQSQTEIWQSHED